MNEASLSVPRAPGPSRPDAGVTVAAGVTIAGAGLVGGTLALLLADQGLEVALIDKAPAGAGLGGGFDGRASAVARATHRVFRAAGLWPLMEDKAAPIEDIRVADGESLLFLHYDSRDVGGPFGYMLENRHMRQAIHQRLSKHPAIHAFSGVGVASVETGAGAATVHLEDGRSVKSPLVIGADGRGSLVREAAGVKTSGWMYGQTAIVCTISHESHHGFVAHEHFLPAGPFAILPILGDPERPGRQSSLVWTERTDLARRLLDLDDREFLAEAAVRFGGFLGPLSLAGPRFSYPLGLRFAHRAATRRLALVGDALHVIHPIAGQGLNMGLRDIAALAEVIEDACRIGLDIGSAPVLERYARWRRFDNALMEGMTDALNRLFSNDIPPVRLARDIGLAAVNKTGGLKRFLMRHAMGEAGELPRIMRPGARGA